MSKVLVVEDDRGLAEAVVDRLRQENLRPVLARTGRAAIDTFRREPFDLVLLDLTLPDIDGLTVCQTLRGISRQSPVIALSSGEPIEARLHAHDRGPDDCIIKPVSPDELVARIHTVWRRTQPGRGGPLRFAHLALDAEAMELYVGSRREQLTVREYAVIELLMRHANQVLSRAEIFQKAWGQAYRGNSNMVDVYINYLRNKTQAAGEPRVIFTIRGRGYVLREPEAPV